MAAVVETARILDPHFHEGDDYWDGDLTLWQLTLSDGAERADLRAVVARGNGFITEDQVRSFVDRKGVSLEELLSRAKVPPAGGKPNVFLPIEPGYE